MSGKNRIQELIASFPKHRSVRFIGATLDKLTDGYAVVSARAKADFLVNSDKMPGGVVQGGFSAGVIPDFACVYAAMTLTKGHALLYKFESSLTAVIVEGEMIIARAAAWRLNKRNIVVGYVVVNEQGELKAHGTMRFREKRN